MLRRISWGTERTDSTTNGGKGATLKVKAGCVPRILFFRIVSANMLDVFMVELLYSKLKIVSVSGTSNKEAMKWFPSRESQAKR